MIVIHNGISVRGGQISRTITTMYAKVGVRNLSICTDGHGATSVIELYEESSCQRL